MNKEKPSPDPRDLRLHRRADYSDPVRLFVARSSQPLDCPSVNISRGGLSVSSKRPLLVGRELSLEVETGEGPVRVESAEVVWTRPLGAERPSDGAYAWEMGLQFICLSMKNRKRMELLVDRLTGIRRGQERSTEPGRGGGARCGPTFDLERQLLPEPSPQPPRQPVEVVVRTDRVREFHGRVLGLAALLLATAALLSFLLIGLTGRDDQPAHRQIKQLSMRLQNAEHQVTVLKNRLDAIMLASRKRAPERPAILSATMNSKKSKLQSIQGGRYFRPVTIALR